MKIGITCTPTCGGSGALATELGIDLAERTDVILAPMHEPHDRAVRGATP